MNAFYENAMCNMYVSYASIRRYPQERVYESRLET